MSSSYSHDVCRTLFGRGCRAFLLTAGIALLAMTGARAAPPIVVLQCGEVLSVPGAEYILQADLVCQYPGPPPIPFALTIVGIGIHLDLNGYTVSRGDANVQGGVLVQADNVTITHGAILGFGSGVRTDPVAHFTMKKVTLSDSVSLQGSSHTLKDNVTPNSLLIAGTNHVVKGNSFNFVDVYVPLGGTVTSNIDLIGNEMQRIRIHPGTEAVMVRDNVVANNFGITVCGSGHVISDNTPGSVTPSARAHYCAFKA